MTQLISTNRRSHIKDGETEHPGGDNELCCAGARSEDDSARPEVLSSVSFHTRHGRPAGLIAVLQEEETEALVERRLEMEPELEMDENDKIARETNSP